MRLVTKVLFASAVALLLLLGLLALEERLESDAFDLAFGRWPIELLAPRWLRYLAFMPFLWLVHGTSLVDLGRAQRIGSLALRSLIFCALALALARPTMPAWKQELSVVFLVDVSASISASQLEHTNGLLKRARRAKGRHRFQVLPFATTVGRVVEGAAPRVTRAARPGDEEVGTDIQAAIQHAYRLFAPETVRRLVLISDGNETRGDALAEAYRCRRDGTPLYAFSVPARRDKEILVASLRLPAEVRVGSPFELSARIYATHAERVAVKLYKDERIDALEGLKQVTLRAGSNTVRFKSLVDEAGVVSYRVAIAAPRADTWPQNNAASAVLPVIGPPRVLYLDGSPEAARALREALVAEDIDVELRGPAGLPQGPAELAAYDLLILSDVAATALGPSQMTAIQDYVRELGGGLLMLGGPDSFAPGGYHGTQVEQLLPVRRDGQARRDQPTVAMMLCIDRSGSMAGPKLELAKEAARSTSELFGPSDLLGVVAFDSAAHPVVRLQHIANPLPIASDIARIQPGGGTNIYPALREAQSQLQPAEAKIKHVILLSDGQSSYGSVGELVDAMAADRITLSAIGVGSGADRTLLQMLAERGGGRFYHTEDPANIPKIFTKEAAQFALSSLVQEPTRAHVVRRVAMLKGIEMASAPLLHGYVSTRAKPLSETVLRSDRGEPLLSWWRVGLGKAAAFTSDAKPRWGGAWLRWDGYAKFWAQLVREVMRHPLQETFELEARIARDEVIVALDARDRDDRFVNGLESELVLVDPAAPQQEYRYTFRAIAAGYYEARFPLPRHGAFLLRARHRLEGRLIAETLGSLSVPYAREYARLRPNNARLKRMAELSGGRFEPKLSELFDPGSERVRYQKDLWPWILLLALALFPLDVLLRRVRLHRLR